jgi:hypothetical protein
MPITAKCLLAVWLSLGTGASTWWAIHGTNDQDADSGVQVAVDAGPTLRAALVLDVDAPDVPKGSPTIEFTTDAGPTIGAALTLDVDAPGASKGSPTIEFVAEPSVR